MGTQLELQFEEWRPVVGYEGYYEVSNLGRVRSLDMLTRTRSTDKCLHKGRILKQGWSSLGYLRVKLCKNKTKKNFWVHRLVAEAFIPNPDNLPQVNHKDENPSNNNVSNLEWCTQKYNNNYGLHNQKNAEKRRNGKSQSKPVAQYTIDGELVKIYPSTKEIERQNGYNNANISRCCRCGYRTAYGYIWKYVV